MKEDQWELIDFVKFPSHGEYEVGTVHKDKTIEKSGILPVVSRDAFVIEPGKKMQYAVEDKYGLGHVVGIAHSVSAYSRTFGWESRIVDGKIYITFCKDSNTILPIPKANYVIQKNILQAFEFFRTYFQGNEETSNIFDLINDWIKSSQGVVEKKRKEEIVVSLTSYPARMQTTWLAIESLLRQTEKPDRIILNLFEGEFPGRVLPFTIRQQMKRGLEINWVKNNLKVFLKVIPSVQKYPNAVIVAVDDDVIYPPERLSHLIDGHKRYPDCVICTDARVMKKKGSSLLPVHQWYFSGLQNVSAQEMGPSNELIPEGIYGVLFPINSFNSNFFFNSQLFFSLCPTDDDLWLYAMSVLNEKKIFKISKRTKPTVCISGSQNVPTSLWRQNGFMSGMLPLSKQCFQVFKHFGIAEKYLNCDLKLLDKMVNKR